MFEKVNPAHPDKVADRIAGALVDLAYTKSENPKIAAEVLIGHDSCFITLETSERIECKEVAAIVDRIAGTGIMVQIIEAPQDEHLAANQEEGLRCGDNGIFKGCPILVEQANLTEIADILYDHYKSDGKYLTVGVPKGYAGSERIITICQSNTGNEVEVADLLPKNIVVQSADKIIINPLGPWTGGLDVDSGATNRKLGSDMGDAITGGGLHGKDLSKADVTLNIFLHLLANPGPVQQRFYASSEPVYCHCSIGDEYISVHNRWGTLIYDLPYYKVVDIAREYIKELGGFEKFAEWGLIRPEPKNALREEEKLCKNSENSMENI